MNRTLITDQIWYNIQQSLINVGFYNCDGLRTNLEGILYRIRVGCPWRDLPTNLFPHWHTIYQFFNRNAKNGKLELLFEILKPELDRSRGAIDSTTIKVHQHGCGAQKGKETLIGISCGGRTTKIHNLVDRHQHTDVLEITAGSAHDAPVFEAMIDSIKDTPYKFILGDKAYHSKPLKDKLLSHGMTPCIPSKINSKEKDAYFSKPRYKMRHVVENAFCRLKQFRAFATRYDKLAVTFQGTVYMALIAANLGLSVPT